MPTIINKMHETAVDNYVYVPSAGLWLALGGSDQGDGTASLLTTGAAAPMSEVSVGNSSTTPLGPGAMFVGAWEDVSDFATIGILAKVDQASATNGAVVQFSTDGVTATRSVATTIGAAFTNIGLPFIIPVEGNYFRIVYTNGAVAQSSMVLETTYHTNPIPPAQFLLGAAITDNNLAQLVKAVSIGKDPVGTYSALRIGGRSTSNNTTSTLLAGAAFTGAWEACSGFVALGITINASHASQTNGLELQFSDDAATIRRTVAFDYPAAVSGTGVLFSTPPLANYFRIVYTNGATDQTSMFLEVRLEPTPTELPRRYLTDSGITDTSQSIMVRGVIAGANDSGAYFNVPITRGKAIKSGIETLTSMSCTQMDVGTAAVQVASSPLNRRRTISLKSLSANTQKIYIGTTSGVSTSNGYELNGGDSVDVEVDDTVTIYAIANSGTQRLAIMQVGEA